MDAHGVNVLDGADDDAVARGVAHDLHLVFLPALQGLLYQDLGLRRELQALRGNAVQVSLGVGHAAAGAAQGEAGANDHGQANVVGNLARLVQRVGDARLRALEANLLHGLGKELAVLARLDGVKVAANDLHAVLLKHAGVTQGDGAVQGRLAAHVGQQGVRPLLLYDLGHGLRGDGLHVGAVRGLRVRHDGCRVGVDQHDLVALVAQGAAGLGAGIVKLAGLANDDGARANDEDLLDVGTLGH